MNTPFLQQVARHYVGVQGLEDYCFVFPNRRSGQFFIHDLQTMLVEGDRQAGVVRPHLMPCVTSINELVARLTGTEAATDIEMTFALYDAYCQVMDDKAQEFDKFIYWSQLIISDFNDIDRSLADVHEIYQNLEDLHELSSNYLPDKVKEKLSKIFGDNLVTAFFDPEADANLWRLFSAGERTTDEVGDDKVKREFLTLWNALESIYHRYHDALALSQVVSPGRQLRQAAEGTTRHLHYSRLVFVGFGVLSAAEVKIFDRFRLEDKADFWWDNAGIQALLDKAPHDPGALLIDGYCKRFGAMSVEPLDQSCQDLRVVAVPSAVGQAKQAFDELALMTGKSPQVGIETAIVLPDESLLVPLLHSVHDVGSMNVTLGYPLRSSSIVSLMHIVARMHHQASKDQEAMTYYREDVNDILSHPLIKAYFTDEALNLSIELARTNRFRVPASEFEAASFADLFRPAMDSEQPGDDREKQASYLDHLLAFCNLLLDRMQSTDAVAEDDEPLDFSLDGGVTMPLQQAFLVMYIDVLNQLKRSLAGCKQSLQRNTVFYLIDRLTAAAMVPFTGEPLRGLQVMGLLETRGLDFKNVIILSMNERVFPRRRSINSFIPNYMRRAHGMSTIEQQEAIVAFNFYRLLNRAEHVTLLYDSSAQKMGTSEPSRYIAQLEKIYGKDIDHVEINPGFDPSSVISIQVPNNAGLRDRYGLDPEAAGGHYLSASAINKYIACPLMFYLHYVQGLNEDNELSDFMDYGTFGDIIHDTLNDCYYCEQSRARGGVIDRDYIVFFKQKRLQAAVIRNIKKHYLHVPEDQLDTDKTSLHGEAYMLIDTIMSYVNFVLDYDLELISSEGPITILECELTHTRSAMQVGDEVFNFKYKPDRVDRLSDGTVRIVDYKTGKDKTSFSSAAGNPDLPDLFDPDKSDRRKAILQLFLYCYAYLMDNPEVKSVTPVIYKLASMDDSGVMMKGGRGVPDVQFVFKLDDPVVQRFFEQMAVTLRSMYQEPFKQAPEGTMTCNYCRFIDFCRRSVTKMDF